MTARQFVTRHAKEACRLKEPIIRIHSEFTREVRYDVVARARLRCLFGILFKCHKKHLACPLPSTVNGSSMNYKLAQKRWNLLEAALDRIRHMLGDGLLEDKEAIQRARVLLKNIKNIHLPRAHNLLRQVLKSL